MPRSRSSSRRIRRRADVHLVGLTGGIASGKSTVARRLATVHGFPVVDADLMAREVVAPGTPGLAAVTAAFGAGVTDASGTLDRAALGRVVFGDDEARARLNSIVHPLVGNETGRRLEVLAEEGALLVVHDVPLLVENDLAGAYADVVVVDASERIRLRRLTEERGMTAEDAWARIRAQATSAQRLAVATHVIRNEGTVDELETRTDEVAAELWAAAGG